MVTGSKRGKAGKRCQAREKSKRWKGGKIHVIGLGVEFYWLIRQHLRSDWSEYVTRDL